MKPSDKPRGIDLASRRKREMNADKERTFNGRNGVAGITSCNCQPEGGCKE